MTTLESIGRRAMHRRMGEVEPSDAFYCVNGDVYQDLGQLCQGLERLTDSQFAFHAQWGTSDFSRWVQLVVGDEELGQDLRQCMTRLQTLDVLKKRIACERDRTPPGLSVHSSHRGSRPSKEFRQVA